MFVHSFGTVRSSVIHRKRTNICSSFGVRDTVVFQLGAHSRGARVKSAGERGQAPALHELPEV